MRMRAHIGIKNFRSIRDVGFPMQPGLNVIVGSNGSGKTNILHALKFLSNIVTSGASLAMAKAGGPARNFRRGEDVIEFSVSSMLDVSLYRGRPADFYFVWGVSVSRSDESGFVYVRKETFRVVVSAAGEMSDVLRAEIMRPPSGGVRTRFEMAPEQDLTKRLFSSSFWVSSSSKKAEIISAIGGRIQDVLQDAKKGGQDASFLSSISAVHHEVWRFHRDLSSLDEYNISPEIARQAVDPLPVVKMGTDGAGVSEVIAALEKGQLSRFFGASGGYEYRMHWYHHEALSRRKSNPLSKILEHVQAAIPSIDSIGTQIDPSSGRRFVVFSGNGQVFRPQEVSDGTFKWLCLLVALYVPASKVVLLEEPENFMHPWMQQRFVALAREFCRDVYA
jgi:predicted ATPase